MKNLIAIFFLVNIIFCQVLATQQNVQQGKQLFNKLKKSGDIGQELFETIQIQLQSADGEDQTIVSKVIELLHEVQADLMAQQQEFITEKTTKDDSCYAQVTGLKEEIKEIEDRVDGLEDNLPLKKDQMDLKKEELDAAKDELIFYQGQLVARDAKAKSRKEIYDEGKEEHDQMIATLEQAKHLIIKLKEEQSFLQQTSRTTTLAQVKQHFTRSLDNVQSTHNKGFLKFLMQVSQVADQEQVGGVIDIIDELIAQITQTAAAEASAENSRKEIYATDRKNIQENIASSEASITAASQAAVLAEKSWRAVSDEVASNKESLASKNLQLDDHRQACDSATSALASRIENFDEILDLIRQVLLLLENSSIQGAKMMVSDTEEKADETVSSGSINDNTDRLGFAQTHQYKLDNILLN